MAIRCGITGTIIMELENRYLVFKRSDIEKHISLATQIVLANVAQAIDHHRIDEKRGPLKCVVVESDWPEYKPTLSAIEARVDAEVAAEVDNRHYCSDGKWWEIIRTPDSLFVEIGQNNQVLEHECFLSESSAYKQKNKWLTKYNMFCPDD